MAMIFRIVALAGVLVSPGRTRDRLADSHSKLSRGAPRQL
jgi:hypothetical protein